MISQSCPRCSSKRIRRGYRPTPLWSKFICRYNLLCDKCNWEFKGFAVPGTVSAKLARKQKEKKDGFEKAVGALPTENQREVLKNTIKARL